MDSPETSREARSQSNYGQVHKFAGKIYLPMFVTRQGEQRREVSYETHIVRRIHWMRSDFSS